MYKSLTKNRSLKRNFNRLPNVPQNIYKGTHLYYVIILKVGRWWWSRDLCDDIHYFLKSRWGGGHELSQKHYFWWPVWILLLLKEHVLYFLRLVCILFPSQKLTNFRGRKRKKKLSWKKKWNENLTFFLHLSTQKFVL